MDRCTPLLDANKFTKLGSEATWATCVGNETVTASEDDVGKALVLYQGILICVDTLICDIKYIIKSNCNW